MAQTRRRQFLHHALVLAAPFVLAPMMLISGCQSNQMLVDRVPPPNFNGPVVTPAPMAAPIAVAPKSETPSRAPVIAKADGSVPKNWIPNAPLRDWKWIVIHHSATPSGSAAVFDRMHKEKGWDELGYDFVIGNGTQSADGQIEVGPRWVKQKWGAHAKTPNNEYNDRGIGICLVGNFDTDRPSAAQVRALTRLTTYLMKTYRISASDVIGHGETKATDCPGRFMNVVAIRKSVSRALAMGDGATLDLDALAMQVSKDVGAIDTSDDAVEAQPASATSVPERLGELLVNIKSESKPRG